jgi:hypothetical protein
LYLLSNSVLRFAEYLLYKICFAAKSSFANAGQVLHRSCCFHRRFQRQLQDNFNWKAFYYSNRSTDCQISCE